MDALNKAMDAIRSNEADRLVITPDGPRGPRHILKRGAFIAARETGLPLYMLTVRYHRRIVLKKSWDRFEVPMPFSKIDIRVDKVDLMDELDDQTLETLSHSFAE